MSFAHIAPIDKERMGWEHVARVVASHIVVLPYERLFAVAGSKKSEMGKR